MIVKQVSIFLENKIGRLAEITALLGETDINMRALAIADTAEFGILRLIVDKPDTACNLLRQRGFAAQETDVIVVEVPDEPGALAQILKVLEESSLNIEYLYAFVEHSGKNALVVFRIEKIKEAVQVLQTADVRIMGPEDIYEL